MAFLTGAMIATILKSVLDENSVKMEKGWREKKKNQQIFFSVIKGTQDLETFTEDIQKPSDFQAVYIKSLEWMSSREQPGSLQSLNMQP